MTSVAPATASTRLTASTDASSRIDEAFRALARAFRAWQLYLPNNPTRERALEMARAAFTAVLEDESDGLVVRVREQEFACGDRVVHREAERPTDGLPWLLYRDGVRELTILPGFADDGLATLLGLLQRAKQAAPDEDDLITMLWVADIPSLRYRFVELGGPVETSVLSTQADGSDDPGDRPGADVPAVETAMPTGAPPGLVRLEDFDSALFFLDQRELAYLQEELRSEFVSEPRQSVLAALFDIVETQRDERVRLEAIQRIEDVLLDVLTTGAYELAATALREARTTGTRAPELTPAVHDALTGLSAQLSEPTVLAQLLQAIDEGQRAPAADVLEALVSELRASALTPLLAWLAHAPTGVARSAVERAVVRLAERHTAELVRHLDAGDDNIVLSALRLCAQLRTAAAVPVLARRVRDTASAYRLEAVQALAAIASPGALQAIEPLIDDADREVRLAALRAVGVHRYAAALPRLSRALQRKELRQAERSEKTAVFDAFGAVCGADGVALLDGMLNARSLLGPRESTEMRACAARALGVVGSELAFAALRRSVDTKDAVVRNEVARALRGGTT